MIVPDVNLLVHAMNVDNAQHRRAWDWWQSTLAGREHIGLSWSVMTGFVRVITNPRILPRPMSVEDALGDARRWLEMPHVRVLTPREEHLHILERLLEPGGLGGNLVPDAHVAALAIEHGGTVYSADRDFSRFPRVEWVNPLAATA